MFCVDIKRLSKKKRKEEKGSAFAPKEIIGRGGVKFRIIVKISLFYLGGGFFSAKTNAT